MKYPIEVNEKRTIKRITVGQAFADFLQAFNVERGLIYTVKLLFINPGKLMRNYLEDGRFRIFNVFRLLVLTTAASLIVLYFFGLENFVDSFAEGWSAGKGTGAASEESTQRFQQIFTDYYNLILWIAIPCYALAMYIFFGNAHYNYAEHMVAQSFYLSGVNLIYVLCFPISYFTNPGIFFLVAIGLGFIYYFYFFSGFFGKRSILFFIKTLIAFLLANILYTMAFAIVLGILIWA